MGADAVMRLWSSRQILGSTVLDSVEPRIEVDEVPIQRQQDRVLSHCGGRDPQVVLGHPAPHATRGDVDGRVCPQDQLVGDVDDLQLRQPIGQRVELPRPPAPSLGK